MAAAFGISAKLLTPAIKNIESGIVKGDRMRQVAKSVPAGSPAKQVAGFIAKFAPKVARLIRSTRAAVRRRFPTAVELVYDNYNFFVMGFCTTERASDCIVSLAANAKG